MRAMSPMLLWIVMAAAMSGQPACAGDTTARIRASDEQSVKESLLALTQERLRPMGLFIAPERAWLSLSGPLPAAGELEVDAAWFAHDAVPSLPLAFRLRSAADGQPLQATLAVPLLREVLVAARRLRKGSVVTCDDLRADRRDIRDVSVLALPAPCEIGREVVALRDTAARDVVRSVDVGNAPDIATGAPVRVTVTKNGINVSTIAIALADANAGDRIDVRLRHPARTLRTRVTGPGAVQLLDESL